MKISAFCLITNPDLRQDLWLESIKSVANFADEIVIIDGSDHKTYLGNKKKLSLIGKHIKLFNWVWPGGEWSWSEFPIRFNFALRNCSGDWAIRFDVDYIFPFDWFNASKTKLALFSDCRATTFQKMSSVLSTRFYEKGGIPLAFNLKFNNTSYGRLNDQYNDLCVPIVVEGFDDKLRIPFGRGLSGDELGKTGLKFYNYDYAFKTKEFTANEFHRFSMAHKKHYGWTKWGESPQESLTKFLEMMQGRLDRCPYTLPHQDQPLVIQDQLQQLTERQFAHSGWGLLVDKSGSNVHK